MLYPLSILSNLLLMMILFFLVSWVYARVPGEQLVKGLVIFVVIFAVLAVLFAYVPVS